ncbi:MAG: hypothetical protein M1825_002177 [Sarcosagium campestre]|nr:MAG: hypothetical protein M1825_002177 [Sarcosagium campestre]
MSLNLIENDDVDWLSQLTAMREAVESLKPLSGEETNGLSIYGHDIPYEDDLLSGDSNSSEDFWDWDDDDEEESDIQSSSAKESNQIPRDAAWLKRECARFAAARPSGLDALQIEESIRAILASDGDDNDVQSGLIDILGFDDLNLVSDIIAHRSSTLESREPLEQKPNGILGGLQTRKERDEALIRQDFEHKHAPLAARTDRDGPQYPHVYKTHTAGNTLTASGKKYALPLGSSKMDHEKYEEYSIPATKVGVLATGQRLVQIAEMDGLCRQTFRGYKSLNRMQSLVYPVAYGTNENMLICAPTGAGKTDAAMLAILNTVARYSEPSPMQDPDAVDFEIDTADFKIVYVAPMKALAAEITEKLGKRLAWLGVRVRELTGDMHLTKQEIMQTQIIVTTPEKWDVVTRKSTGDTELVQKVRLLIIDEVHMLHDERGAVIESLVARTQRQVESTQSLIRIVGLSATLPNYLDVADFLKVNRMAGLFYFDASFRPVPLEQHFIGVKGKAGSKTSRENLETTTFEKVREMLELGHQIMVFVHSRKDTVNTAKLLYKMAVDQTCTDLFDPKSHQGYDQAVRDMKSSRGREIRDLLPKGIGTHHAGMPRSDRSLVERLFGDGVLKVLCTTATLAWGVNLPAAAVIIKGTQLYSAQEGKFVDVGILDVLQIFGRAGRPQFQDSGIGFICTTHDKLAHYLTAVTQQQPIESRFSARLVDNLNAEIALGTVTSIAEAVQWLGYSYLFVRMQRNPMTYGIEWAQIRDDPRLVQRRRELVINAARTLQRSQMIIFNETTEELRSKDVGRIASQFYVLQTSVEIFNSMMRPAATEEHNLKMISMSGEFDSIQSRDSESKELSRLIDERFAPRGIEGGIDQSHTKTNVLLQSYISRAHLEDFTLVSDTAYVAQNAARICRALFLIALNRRWGHQCLVLSSLCKSIERQVWSSQHPLHQFDLPQPVLRNLDTKGHAASVESLREMEPTEVGQMVHNHRMGGTISTLLDSFPTLTVEAEIFPLNRDVLRIRLFITPDFRWSDRHNGTSESYWIWVENSETSEIYHHESFFLTRKKLHHDHELNFTIPLSTDPLPSQIYVRAVSDRWLGADTVYPISFQHLIRPDTESVFTDLLNLQPLPISALKDARLEEIYGRRFQFFNPMQTQIFHPLYHTAANVLLGSPTGSGKTVAAELAMWWAFRERPRSKVVYIAPMKALVRERVQDWGPRLARPMGLKLVELTGDNTPDTQTIRDADIIVTTPEKWDGISRSWQTRGYVRQVSLVIIDEIHLLGGDRGPILEIIVSRMNYIAAQSETPVRVVGMSTACANASDLGNWLGVKEGGLFNFRHSVRPVPLEIFIDGFPEVRGFCPFMHSMSRPTFLAIKTHSPDKPVIVFVPSRRQTRLSAKDLINLCGMEENPRRFLKMSEEELQLNLTRVKDQSLKECLTFGIGLHHAGLVESDRQLAQDLFANSQIQILVATSTLAWGVNLPAHLVVVKGTQFYDAKLEGYKDMDLTDVLQMLGRAGRPQFDSSGIARILTQDSKKAFYKHFLHTGFPVESSLHLVLENHFGAEICAETIATKQDALDYLTWTFFFRRLHKNPSYYGLEISSEEHNTIAAQTLANEFMVELVDKALRELDESSCITVYTNGDVEPTPLGKTMSFYYLSHKTIRHLVQHAKRDATFADVLSWLSCATEYDELPVRHNEDLINAELSKNLPLQGESLDLPMFDPHVKAFLLLQAFMSRIELPISDYVTDQNSVLDQAIRIIQASIDVLTELGYLSSCMMMIKLLQCIKSALWPEDPALAILPGIPSPQDAASAAAVSGRAEPRPGYTLHQLAAMSTIKELEDCARQLKVPREASAQFQRVVGMLPHLTLSVTDIGPASLTVTVQRHPPNKTKTKSSQTSASSSTFQQADSYRAWTPKFPKPQTEAFFLIVANAQNDEIVALKRLTWPSTNPSSSSISNNATSAAANATGSKGSSTTGSARSAQHDKLPSIRRTVKWPAEEEEDGKELRRLNVMVVSDSYRDMIWTKSGIEVPPKPPQTVGVEPGLEKAKNANA